MSGILLVVHQDDRLLWSHRRWLVAAALAAGWEVHLAGPASGWSEQLVSLGAQVHELPLERSWSPVQLWRARGALRKLVREVRPDIAQTVHLRPTLVAGPVLRDVKIPTTCLIAGLGMLGQWAPRWVGARLSRLFRDSDVLGQVQNQSDADFLMKHGHCDPSRVTRLAGSGVDLRRFSVQPLPSGIPVVLFAGRLL